MSENMLKTSFMIERDIIEEAKALGIVASKAARKGVIDAIAREKKIRELLGE